MAELFTLKKGDRVQVTDLEKAGPFGAVVAAGFLEVGDRGTLTEDDTDGVPYVKWDEKYWGGRGNNGDYAVFPEGLEKIDE